MGDHLMRLGIWSGLSLIVSLFLLRSAPTKRGFGILTLGWSVVNLAIVGFSMFSLKNPPPALGQFREFMSFNMGLNVAYVAVGVTLMAVSKEQPFRRGMGLAVIIQGLALLVLDGYLLSVTPAR